MSHDNVGTGKNSNNNNQVEVIKYLYFQGVIKITRIKKYTQNMPLAYNSIHISENLCMV